MSTYLDLFGPSDVLKQQYAQTVISGYYLHTYGTYTHDDGSTDNIYVSDYYPHSDAYEVQLFHSRTKLLRFGSEMQAKYTLHPDQGAASVAWHNHNSNATPRQGYTVPASITMPMGYYVPPWGTFNPGSYPSPQQPAAAIKCECGAEKAGQPSHSTWCAKHGK